MTVKTLDFTTLAIADPVSPPVGYSQLPGSHNAKIFNTGVKEWMLSGAAQSVWIDNTLLTGTTIKSTVKMGAAVAQSAGPCLIDLSGNGVMIITNNGANSFRPYLVVNCQLSGSPLVTALNIPSVTNQIVALERNTGTNLYTMYVNGAPVGTFTSSVYDPRYAGAVSRFGYIRELSSEYTPAQTITSINGGNPITAGQTGIAIEATGFTAKPTGVTATYASGAKSITATIDSGGTATNFNISIQDRIEAEDWPVNGDTLTFTFTYLSESATGTQTLVKKASETVLTVSGGITSDPATWTYWLTQDGFTVEGGEHDYIPYGDLVLTADGGGSATDAGTFTSWWRPSTGAGAGNVYAYTWVITEAGISPAGSGLTSSGLTVSGLTIAGLTSSGL